MMVNAEHFRSSTAVMCTLVVLHVTLMKVNGSDYSHAIENSYRKIRSHLLHNMMAQSSQGFIKSSTTMHLAVIADSTDNR